MHTNKLDMAGCFMCGLELFASWAAVQSDALQVVPLSKPAQHLSDAAIAVLACFMLKPHAMKYA